MNSLLLCSSLIFVCRDADDLYAVVGYEARTMSAHGYSQIRAKVLYILKGAVP